MEKIVSLHDVSVKYQSNTAIEGATLNIYDNDFIGIIGPNGGGKTTLVKAVLGSVEHSGEVEYAPQLYVGGHRLIGYLPQHTDFDRQFPLSIREVIMSGLQSQRGFGRRYTKADAAKAEELMAMAHISHLADKQLGEVSGGELQRALLCRAVILDPKLLILDEPTNFVDNRFENELYTLLRELNNKMAIVMVSHDIGTITSVVKSIVCVNRTVHRHDSNIITAEQLENYHCPIQIISHGHIPHTVLGEH